MYNCKLYNNYWTYARLFFQNIQNTVDVITLLVILFNLKRKLKLEVILIHQDQKKQEFVEKIICEFSSNKISLIDYIKKLCLTYLPDI